MKSSETQVESRCQVQCLDRLRNPTAEMTLPPPFIRWRLRVTRRLDQRTKRAIVRHLNRVSGWISSSGVRNKSSMAPAQKGAIVSLQPGDMVRVRSREEIEGTLDRWRKLKGCTFIPVMLPYCGTTQRVLKPVRRFLDERDNQLKKVNGLVLLEAAMCQGTEKFGACDRSCFYFWREEWLERIE